jgi:hypothetical protein
VLADRWAATQAADANRGPCTTPWRR